LPRRTRCNPFEALNRYLAHNSVSGLRIEHAEFDVVKPLSPLQEQEAQRRRTLVVELSAPSVLQEILERMPLRRGYRHALVERDGKQYAAFTRVHPDNFLLREPAYSQATALQQVPKQLEASARRHGKTFEATQFDKNVRFLVGKALFAR